MKKTDRSKCKNDLTSQLLGESDQCQDAPDEEEIKMSSIKTKEYNQQHCIKSKGMKMFEAAHKCSIFPLFGTNDLDSPLPMCGRSNIQKLMKMMSKMKKDNATLLTCPKACIEEHVETSVSFTSLSEEQVKSTSTAWNLTKLAHSKDDVVIMEVYFSSSQTEVRKIRGKNSSEQDLVF